MTADGRYDLLADLAVRVGANVQPGQVVSVSSEPGKEPATRAAAAAAYRAGAKFVDVQWFDPWVKRERIAHAPAETLDYVPPWLGERLLALGDAHAARITFAGAGGSAALEGLDPARAARDQLPWLKEVSPLATSGLTNWTIVPCPTVEWARLVHPEAADDVALERLWEQILHVCRLDEDDPRAAWEARTAQLAAAAATLGGRGFDALHYEGPGTDLTVGLLPSHRWTCVGADTVFGVHHFQNLPSEEVFTTPDPARADGVVAATMPLALFDGTIVRDLVVRFAAGRVTELTASSGEEAMRAIVGRDEGAGRLGELALVDDGGRIGALDTVFYSTLLDENAASHIAIGNGLPFTVDDDVAPRVNTSDVHVDFMIGSRELTVTGIAADGGRTPVLVGERWAL